MKTKNLNVNKNQVTETSSKLNGLVLGFYAGALDSEIQLAAMLRNNFRRADLALVISRRHMINGLMNIPYFNNTLLATLVDLKMLDEAKPVSENLMKFSPVVLRSIKRVLATQCRYLLEVFVSTGDLDYLDEAGKIMDRMPGSGVEQSFYLRCLARYLSLRGEKDKSAQAFEDSQQITKTKERVHAPSSFKLLESQLLENSAIDLREFALSSCSLNSELLRVDKSIPDTLNESGFVNVSMDSDQKSF